MMKTLWICVMIIFIKVKYIILVILVGDMGVGKTSLLSKYVKGIFPTSPLPTIAIEFATKIIQLKAFQTLICREFTVKLTHLKNTFEF